MKTPRLVVRSHHPLRDALIGLAVLAVLLLSLWLVIAQERERWASERAGVVAERDYLRDAVTTLRERRDELRRRLAVAERENQVRRKAYADVEAHLRSLQDRVLELEEEVAFYRDIVEADQGRGLSIQRFVVHREGRSSAYRFALVLTRHLRSDKVVRGKVSLSVAGEREGRTEQLSLSELSTESGRRDLPFEFKYFQRLEGTIRLPGGFVPYRVHVVVDAPDARPARFEKTYEWDRAVS